LPSLLSGTELAAISAIGRGATQLRMAPRTRDRLLALGLISTRRNDFTVTDAGRRASGRRRSPWI
jgi:hypothetical protein